MTSKRHCLAAFTPPGSSYPPYFNASVENGVVTVLIRDVNQVHAQITMGLQDWYNVIEQSRAKVLMAGEIPVEEELRKLPLQRGDLKA